VTGPDSSRFRPRFFVPEVAPAHAVAGEELSLSPADSHHARDVLRLVPGDECEVVVGAAVYAASVSTVTGTARVRLERQLGPREAGAAYRLQVGVAQALVRPAALDTILEKGTEVGCSFFLLVPVAGSPPWADARREDRVKRWSRIVEEAAKQSKQVVVPDVASVGSIDEAFDRFRRAGTVSVVLDPLAPVSLAEVLAAESQRDRSTDSFALWVGPEGGWEKRDAAIFEAAGASRARLGRGILRTETAGPVAVALARLLLGDW
jgi:16S rRNA (uracil1498-N3)-methyltransferase